MGIRWQHTKALRWVHFLFGLIAVVFWTGVIKWQLPRISRWRARDKIRQARASS